MKNNFDEMFEKFKKRSDDKSRPTIDELKKQGKRLENTIRMMAEITEDPVMIYKVKEIDLTQKLTKISVNMENITRNQYEELTNMLEQFSTIVDDYIEENEIVLKEKI